MAKEKAVKAPKVSFPKTLYVFETECDHGDKFFMSDEHAECCDDGKIGVYGLIEVVNKRTETILE